MFKSYQETLSFIETRIPRSSKQKFPGGVGLQRAKLLMHLLGDPQDKLKVIHVAGTSGKGSTAYLTALGLSSLGFKVGLHLSPHLLDLRERFQIFCNSRRKLINKTLFRKYTSEVVPTIQRPEDTISTKVTYFEFLTALAFYFFKKEKVDYAVVETGLGGLYDSTNVVCNTDKLCIITQIGLDHIRTLGNNIELITKQKAGIIYKGNSVVYLKQSSQVNSIIAKRTRDLNGRLYPVGDKRTYSNVTLNLDKTEFDFHLNDDEKLKKIHIKLGLTGLFQAKNASLALTAINTLSKRDNFKIQWSKLKLAFSKASFTGRFQKVDFRGKVILLDGAHNEQKTKAFIRSLTQIFPNKKFVFFIGFKRTRDFRPLLKVLLPTASYVFVTKMGRLSVETQLVSSEIHQYNIPCENDPDIVRLFNRFIHYLRNEDVGVVTGSLHLVGEVMKIMNQ